MTLLSGERMPDTPTITPATADSAIRVLATVRRHHPLVQCLTNTVVAGFTANVLLAVGAAPAMVDNTEESAEFAAMAGAVLVNLGALTPEGMSAMRAAVAAANRAGTPWVLDPVAVGVLGLRTRFAATLLAARPAVIRGNPSEVMSLAGVRGAAGRGVDSTSTPEQAVVAAVELARRTGATVAVSGPIDYVTDGSSTLFGRTGHEIMTRVTGVGCSLGALVAACCAVESSPLVAASAATTILTVAAERAEARSQGPGSFAVALLDELYLLDAESIRSHVAAAA